MVHTTSSKTAVFADRLNASGKPNWSKREKLYVTERIASEAAEDGSDLKLEACSKKWWPKWTDDLDKDKQMFCVSLVLEDNYNDAEDANDEDVLKYRKKAKRVSKAMRK